MSKLSVGEKIKTFRKRAGLSQLQLETEIGASAGSISRIESGSVNPTKETIHQIATELDLTEKERADLFNITSLKATPEEVQSALDEISDIFSNPNFMGYLLDDWWILRAVSPGLATLLELKKDRIEEATGQNILEVLFNPHFGVRDKLDPQKLIQNYAVELARARGELNDDLYPGYFSKIENNISYSPHFGEINEQSKQVSHEQLTAGSRISHLLVNGQKIKIMHAREKLKDNPRFEIIEFCNPQPYE